MKRAFLKNISALLRKNIHQISFAFLAAIFLLPFLVSAISLPSIPQIPGVPLPGGGEIISISPTCNPTKPGTQLLGVPWVGGYIDQTSPECENACKPGKGTFSIKAICNPSQGTITTSPILGCENVCTARGGGSGGSTGSGAVKPFGGKSEQITYCTCSDAILHKVGPPVGGNFVYVPGQTTLYEYYQIYTSGVQLLGNYQSGGQCLVYRGTTCSEEQVDGTMTQVGTSKSS